MSGVVVLAVVAIFQGIFLVLLVGFIGVRRQVERQRDAALAENRRRISEPLSSWLVGASSVDELVGVLRTFPPGTALAITSNLARTAIPADRRAALATAVRDEPWVRASLAGATSRRWGRRLEAARCLALAGTPSDGAILETLLNDPRPAVGIAAVNALPLVADARLVGEVLDRLVMLPGVVRVYLQDTLRELRSLVEPALAERLSSPDASARALARWTELAAALELPTGLERASRLATHPDARVRVAVARALRRVPTRRSTESLGVLLRDTDDAVRGAAAHALGELGAPSAIPSLLAAAHDPSWSVRYRATIALTQLGEQGRAAVRSLRTDGDRYVADMATLITGLGDGALLDMAEA